jgi:nitrogen fixation protein FixH
MNWGTKIVLGMAGFMLFIIGMVIYMFYIHGSDPLIEEDYYEKGIAYNQHYNAKQAVFTDNIEPTIKISENQIILLLKDSASYELKLLRPSTAKEDLHINGNTIGISNLILIDRNKMYKGLWFLQLKWVSQGKEYFYEKEIKL